MAPIDKIQVDLDSYIGNAEIVKKTILDELVKQELLDEEEADKFNKNYGLVLYKDAWYKNIFTKPKNNWYWKIIKF